MICWAASLGDCGDGVTGEHYVSHGIFDSKSIVVSGFPWCRERPVTIGLGSAVANILCGRHNSGLSEFDQEATKFSRFLTENVRDTPLSKSSITLNGVYLEKWALKTFLNLGHLRALHHEQEQRLVPPQYLIEYLYRDGPIPEGVGLYFVTSTLNNEDFALGLSWNVVRNKKKLDQNISEVLGIVFIFNSIRFAISITPVRAEKKIVQMGEVGGFDYSNASVFYRPDNIILNSKTAGQKRIHLKW